MKGFREWFRKKILLYQSTTSGRTDWLQRLPKPAMVTYLSLLFFAVYHIGPVTGDYAGEIGFVYMIGLISLGSIVVAHEITVYGRWYVVLSIGLLIVMTLLVFLFAS